MELPHEWRELDGEAKRLLEANLSHPDLVQYDTAQWAKSGFFVQWVYWVYLFSQNTRPLCNAAMYEQV